MTLHLLHWERVLQRSGHRVTQQRGAIFDAVCAGGGHKSVDEVFSVVRGQAVPVDRSTIYRTLRLFVQLGLVVEANVSGEATRYEMKQLVPHHHLVCQVCGAAREVTNDALAAMIAEIYDRHQFAIDSDHLVLHGVCRGCTIPRREPAPPA